MATSARQRGIPKTDHTSKEPPENQSEALNAIIVDEFAAEIQRSAWS
ncbi:hypothetical protein CGCVW01_v007590 [Colletotrichum viniferum]|nr:hypothetical protein CGCVW01_v007590 [Colletotrichum viniferum]